MERPPATYQVNGAALRRARMSRGLLPWQLAQKAGLSRSYIQRIEDGTASGRMRPGTYIRLRTALQATNEELLVEESPRER